MKSTAVKRLLQTRKKSFTVLRQHPDVRIPNSASSYMPRRKHCAVVLCCAYDDSLFRNKFFQNIFVPRTVLQCQKAGLLPNHAPVPRQCGSGKYGLHKQNDQVHLPQPFRVGYCRRMPDIRHAILVDFQPFAVDLLYNVRIRIYQIYLMIL